MSIENLKKTRYFPLWKEEKELNWLCSMSKSGWHLSQKGYLTYIFENDADKEYIFAYDHKKLHGKDFDEYKELAASCGWKYISSYDNYHYFKAKPSTALPVFFESVTEKKKILTRILLIMLTIAIGNSSIILINIWMLMKIASTFSDIPILLMAIWGVSVVVILALIATSIKIGFKIRKLNKVLYG